jgi:hypothetical protein
MRKPLSTLVLLLLLGFCVSLTVPAEDVPGTAYDESETLPYEGRPVFSIVRPQASARIAKAVLSGTLPSVFSTERRKRRCESSLQFHCVPVSLTILKHSLRC